MIRLIFISCILMIQFRNGFAQVDTSSKKSSDTVAVVPAINNDTLQKKTDTVAKSQAAPVAGSDEVYKLNLAVDIPLTAITAGWSIFAFPKIYDKDPSSEASIRNLKEKNINGFDRWVTNIYSESAAKTSDYFFYGSIPLPFLLLLDREIRKDALKVGFLYLEAMSVTGLFYTGSAYLWDRYRPLTYNDDYVKVPMSERTGGNERNSFLGGHPALVATSTFFMASVYDHYHPDSKFKYALYGVAIVATGTTAYLRHRGGKHFPTDLIVGTTIGTLSGLMVPRLHKNKAYANSKVRVMPFTGESHGLHLVYKL